MSAAPRRPTIASIGAGGLAHAFLPALERAGYPVALVVARSLRSARRLARRLRAAEAGRDPVRAARVAELLLLAVPDAAVGPLARDLARDGRVDWRGKTVLHHAGALGPEPLAPLGRAGAAIGVLHPLQCLGRADLAAELLPGSAARIEGRGRAGTCARRLARDLGLRPLATARDLAPGDRAAYHAAASLASNDVVALLSCAVDLLCAAGISRPAAATALARLARGTLRHADGGRLRPAMTGPVVRGDAATVEAHLDVLRRAAPDAHEVHRLLAARMLELVDREGLAIDPAARRRLARALGRRTRP